MTNLVAKPIVNGQLWVITDGQKKIGNIEANGQQYTVKIGGTVDIYANTKNIERAASITFEKPSRTHLDTPPFAHWPTPKKRTYNNYWDVRRKIHVFTKTADSKCYYGAGYYNLKIGDRWQTMFCPKYIFIQRYPYNGPHLNLDQAQAALNTSVGENLNE